LRTTLEKHLQKGKIWVGANFAFLPLPSPKQL